MKILFWKYTQVFYNTYIYNKVKYIYTYRKCYLHDTVPESDGQKPGKWREQEESKSERGLQSIYTPC